MDEDLNVSFFYRSFFTKSQGNSLVSNLSYEWD